MKIGRNEARPCGSGKKYKWCREAAPDMRSPPRPAWRRASRQAPDQAPKLLNFIDESHGPGAIPDTWEDHLRQRLGIWTRACAN
jgi:hypothetical protein